MRQLRAFGLSLGLGAAALACVTACDDAPFVAGAVSSVASGAGGFSAASGPGGMTSAGSGGNGGDSVVPPPLKLALDANPSHEGQGPPTAGERLAAELTSYAAGVRAVVVAASWPDLEEPTGLDALAARVAELRARGLDVVVVLDLVDRRASGRPARLEGESWDSAGTLAALDATLTALVQRFGKDLAALVLGRGANVHAAQQADSGAALAVALEHAVAKVSALPQAPTHVAVGLAFDGAPLDKMGVKLASVGSAAAFSYAPNLGQSAIPNATSAAKDLDAMLAIAAMRPVYLTEVSFTSAVSLGATLMAQSEHMGWFFSALEPRRSGYRVVSVARLHDLDALACSQRAERQGLAVDAPEITYACAAGLRESSGNAKPAWQAFLKAAAVYSPP